MGVCVGTVEMVARFLSEEFVELPDTADVRISKRQFLNLIEKAYKEGLQAGKKETKS